MNAPRTTLWEWLFRSRVDGRIVIASWPNLPLWTWIATVVLRRLTPIDGTPDRVVAGVGTAALLVWAAAEVWSGVNPWRRLLGLVTLVAVVVGLLRG